MADDTTIRTKIVLEGEAQYRAAMADINRQLKETKSALSAAAAEYANADAATRTSAAQAEALNRSLDLQRERLAMMEEQLKKVEDAYGQNSRQAVELRTKINNARTEMAKTQTQLRGLSDGLEGAADAGEAMGSGADSAAGAIGKIGDSAQEALGDVRGLADEIGGVVGKKLIEFGVGKEALSQLADGVKWAFGEAISGATEDAHARALAGDNALSERRTAIKDAVDRQWAGRRDGMTTVGDVAAVDTALGNAGISDDARVTKLTNWAITIEEVFGQDVQSTLDRATAMVNTFGVSWETALDLMTKGQRDFSDGGAQMLSAMETYGQAYKQLGYDIDDMYSALSAAANDYALGKDSNLNKGVENFVGFVTEGSKASQEALAELGIEITDLPGKFQKGGAAAALASQEILMSLQNISDETRRNDLGKTIFGEKIWIDSAGRIADVLLAGFGQTVDFAGATADAMAAELDNFSDAWAQTGERASQEFGKKTEPVVDAVTDALQTLNRNADETGGLISGLLASFGDANEQMATRAAQAFDQAKDNYDAWAREVANDVEAIGASVSERVSEQFYDGAAEAADTSAADAAGQRWVDVLRGSVDSAAAEGEQSEAIASMLNGMLPDAGALEEPLRVYAQSHHDAVVAQMETAYGQENDEDYEAWKLFQQRMIDSAYDESVEQAGQLGEDTAGAATDAIEEAEPDAQAAGDTLGGAAVYGLQSGLSGLREASGYAVDGAVATLYGGMDRFYNAGYAAGKAYERGYQNALDQHSPSRVMRLAAQYSVEGLLEGYDDKKSEAAERGAAIAEAFNSAYTGRSAAYAGAGGAADAGTGISADALAEAVREALSGAGVYLDGQRVGELTAPGVSSGIARSAASTVRGRSARAKGW